MVTLKSYVYFLKFKKKTPKQKKNIENRNRVRALEYATNTQNLLVSLELFLRHTLCSEALPPHTTPTHAHYRTFHPGYSSENL